MGDPNLQVMVYLYLVPDLWYAAHAKGCFHFRATCLRKTELIRIPPGGTSTTKIKESIIRAPKLIVIDQGKHHGWVNHGGHFRRLHMQAYAEPLAEGV